MGERVVPDAPGWWWLCDGGAYRAVHVDFRQYRGEPDGLSVPEDDGTDVEWSGYDWLAPVLTPPESAALLARAEAAEAENARLRGLALRIADALDEAFDALALLGRDVTMDEFIYAAGGRTVAAIEPACGGLRAKAAALRKMAALAEVNHG